MLDELHGDCWTINNIIIKYRHPIPRLDDMLDVLHGANIFSKLILKVAIIKSKLKKGMDRRLLSRPGLDCMSG